MDHYSEQARRLSPSELERAREQAQARLEGDAELRFWAVEDEPRSDAFTTAADGTRLHLSDNHLFITSVLSTLELL